MKIAAPLAARLDFLVRVMEKECRHLLDTDRRLFVSRFGRLQDTVGDKLLPALLMALAETPGPAIDNLDKAEKFGLIVSTDVWMEIRRLRNQMVHEYIEDLAVLSSALRSGHNFVPELVSSARRCMAEVQRLLQK